MHTVLVFFFFWQRIRALALIKLIKIYFYKIRHTHLVKDKTKMELQLN